jgi:hypothetical protein
MFEEPTTRPNRRPTLAISLLYPDGITEAENWTGSRLRRSFRAVLSNLVDDLSVAGRTIFSAVERHAQDTRFGRPDRARRTIAWWLRSCPIRPMIGRHLLAVFSSWRLAQRPRRSPRRQSQTHRDRPQRIDRPPLQGNVDGTALRRLAQCRAASRSPNRCSSQAQGDVARAYAPPPGAVTARGIAS